MKNTLYAFFIALIIVGSEGSPKPFEGVDTTDTTPMKDAIKTAIEWSELQDLDGVTYLPNTEKPFNGYAKRRYENEQMEILAQIKDGYVVRLKQWQENGNPKWDVGLMEGKVGVEGMPNKRVPILNEYSHGPATHWHDNGQKASEGNFKDGKLEGLLTLWYANGQKRYEMNWKDGKKDGLKTEYWRENGQKASEGNYKDDKHDGLWTIWFENGQKLSEGNFKDGKPDGLETWWYENGQKGNESNYKDGKLISAVTWKPNGEKCPVTNLKDGDGIRVLYAADGTEISRDVYKDGIRVSSPLIQNPQSHR